VTQPLRFGVLVLPNTDYAAQAQRWQQVEALGFDSLWDCDHFVNPYQPTQTWFEGWTLLAAMATQTTRVRIGTLITSAVFRNPAFLARQALTVDHISGGRLELGLGTGASGHDPSYPMTGINDYPPAERVARFREVVEIVDQMLRNPVTTYQGDYYKVNEVTMNPAPVQQPRPPLTLAALGPKTIRIAAQYADTWNFYPSRGLSLDEAITETRQRNELFDRYCAEIGRDRQTIRRSLLLLNTFAKMDSPEVFTDTISRYHEIGISEFIIYYPATDNQLPDFECIASETIPSLRVE